MLCFCFLTVEDDQPDIPPIEWTASLKYTPIPYEENFDICSKAIQHNKNWHIFDYTVADFDVDSL